MLIVLLSFENKNQTLLFYLRFVIYCAPKSETAPVRKN